MEEKKEREINEGVKRFDKLRSEGEKKKEEKLRAFFSERRTTLSDRGKVGYRRVTNNANV